MRKLGRVISLLGLAALVLAASSSASVRKLGFTPTVRAGDYASVRVQATPKARCTITVVYDTTVSHAHGLGSKSGTKLVWRWRVGTAMHSGWWPVTISCGKRGTLKLKLHVTR